MMNHYETVKTLFLLATDVQFGTGAIRVPKKYAHTLRVEGINSLCIILQRDPDIKAFEIYYAKSGEIDYNGSEYFIKFISRSLPIAIFPGTGMFAPEFIQAVIKKKIELLTEIIPYFSNSLLRKMDHTLGFQTAICERVYGYSAHLDAKESTIKNQQDRLNLHESVLRKEYWIWEDDFEENNLESLNCPILITPDQLQAIINKNK